jgi:hypothetical protein
MYATFQTKYSITQYPLSHVWVKVSVKGEGTWWKGVRGAERRFTISLALYRAGRGLRDDF